MNDVKLWQYESHDVRTIEKDGEPWFVGKDVADILGYSNTRDALAKRVDAEDKMDGVAICDSIGREQTPVFINESGLYSLILSSKLPDAKKFKRWVTSEVLPSIRKHGAYMTESTLEKVLTSPDFLIQLATQLKTEQEQRRKLETTVAVQNQQIAELQPKANYYEVVLNCKDLLSITSIAKDYGKSGTWLNKYLHEKGVQYKQGKIWLLYQKYAEKGYTSTKTQTFPGNDGQQHTKVHTYWTQQGRLFIYELLKSNDILPLIEQAA